MKKSKILLVDDEPDIIYLVRRFLEREGYNVVEAYGGREALRKTVQEQPDLILLDVMMPDLDGWDVSRTLKTDDGTQHIPIVMLTVRASFDSQQKSFEYAYADAHLAKPASGKEIVSAVDSALKNTGRDIEVAQLAA
ncbi:alkaline phosphatase synthesis transcriptional regulatory protein PhoP [archaeon BMS3Abin16]|nr:alkaline phosphatase synthesis transcriptional regulatory protein PhoP [archaeon BMS3Abin16]